MKKWILLILVMSCLKSIKNIELKNKDINEELLLAINNCSISKILELINRGVDVNGRDDKGNSALMLAAKEGHRGVVKTLIWNGAADINYKNYYGNTALMIASEYGNKEVVKLLIKVEADVNEKNCSGWSPLMMVSASNGCLETARLLIEYGANVNYKDNINRSILNVASANGYLEMMELLIEKRANLNHQDDLGFTPLISALNMSKICAARLLIESGANINIKDTFGNTALKIAYENGLKEVVELLVSKGVDIKELNNISLEDLLINSIKNRHAIRYFLIMKNYSDKIDFNYKDKEGNGSLHYAVLINDIGLVQGIIERGGYINLENNKGETPLYFAINQKKIDKLFLLYLLGKGAILKPNLYNKDGSTLDISFLYQKLLDELILEPRAKKILGHLNISDEDRKRLKDIIYILKIKEQDFEKEKEMLAYIKNVFILKNSKVNLNIEDIENIKIEREELVDFDLEADYILGAAFDLGKDEYYGNDSLENIREAFKDRLINIVKTKAPSTLPSINATDEQKSQYVRYLTKKRLRILSLRLSEIAEEERKERLGWIMNQILTNLSCLTGTLEAINHAVNCLLGNDNEINLKEIINRELMLYRVSLLEEVAKKYLHNRCISIMLDETGRGVTRNKGEYSEHMKAYLVMDLYEELKVTGLYEKDFKYDYDKTLVIEEVKRLYKERALDYIIKHITDIKQLNNKVREYLEENIFKDRKLEKENETVFHIENFIYDEGCKLTREAIIALLAHFRLLRRI